jgi:hypothetical protein
MYNAPEPMAANAAASVRDFESRREVSRVGACAAACSAR